MKTLTENDYEEYLNEIDPPYDSDEWIIAGKRCYHEFEGHYGAAIRKRDPIAFRVGFQEWRREHF